MKNKFNVVRKELPQQNNRPWRNQVYIDPEIYQAAKVAREVEGHWVLYIIVPNEQANNIAQTLRRHLAKIGDGYRVSTCPDELVPDEYKGVWISLNPINDPARRASKI